MISERLGTYILYIFMIIYSGLLYSDLKKNLESKTYGT